MTLHLRDPVEKLLLREPIVARADETLRTVARRLWSESVGAVVVIGERGRPVGVLSERDIVSALAGGAGPDTATVREVMTSSIISVRPRDVLWDVAGQMLDDGVRHLPVTAEDGRLVGMVSVRDLLRPLIVDAIEGPER